MMKKSLLIIFTISLFVTNSFTQENKEYILSCIGFYNFENLFDTIDQENVRDFEFTPNGKNAWNSDKYHKKLDNLTQVISEIGEEYNLNGPAILGISEIENKSVLEDLVKHPNIKNENYQIVHYNSPDRRGIDVGLIYKPSLYKVYNSNSHLLSIDGRDDFYSRDQLVVSGVLLSDTIHVIVNHWPSRSGGEKRSRPLRNAAADLTKSITDSLYNLHPDAKIVILGDLNDDPNNQSLLKHLKAKKSSKNLEKQELYNPMYQMYKKGIGSLAYRDSWNLFDQSIVSESLVNDQNSFRFYTAKVFKKKYMLQQEGRYKGYPLRTYAGGVYKGGYSDHFPVYIYLIKEK